MEDTPKQARIFPVRRLAIICVMGAVLLGTALYMRQLRQSVPSPVPDGRTTEQYRQLEQEISRLHNAVAIRPDDVNSRFQLAQKFLEIEEGPAGEAQLRDIVRRDPNHKQAWQLLAKVYFISQRPGEAEKVYRRCVKRWSTESWSYAGLAATLKVQGRLREALAVARQAVARNPQDITNQYALGVMAQEYAESAPVAGTRNDEYNLARSALQKVIKAMPDDSKAELRLGKVYLALKRNKEALAAFERVLKRSPDSVEALGQLAGAYLASSDLIKARAMSERAVAANPNDARTHDLLGQILLRSQQPEALTQAVNAFTQAVRLNPTNGRYHERLGTAYLRLNKLKEARESFEQAQRITPERPFPLQQLASIYNRLGLKDLAATAAKSAEGLSFNEQQLKRLQARSTIESSNIALRFVLADRYLAINWLEVARDEYQAILELEPNNRRAAAGLEAVQKKMQAGQHH